MDDEVFDLAEPDEPLFELFVDPLPLDRDPAEDFDAPEEDDFVEPLEGFDEVPLERLPADFDGPLFPPLEDRMELDDEDLEAAFWRPDELFDLDR